MNKIVQIFSFILFIAILMIAKAYASENSARDDGRDKNGDLIVAKTIALRCGMSSHTPDITVDCINRLAYDYKTGKIPGGRFENYAAERKAILNDYANAYIQKAIEQLLASSSYKDRIDEMLCNDTTDTKCMSITKDTREELENNNKLAADNATIMLDAIRLRASQLNMDGVKNILYNLVPSRDIDINDSSLAEAP